MRVLLAALLLAVPVRAADLSITSIDVDGGAATLFVTPGGKSLLIDTGWPAGRGTGRPLPGEPPPAPAPSSAQRIIAVARAHGLSRIDKLLISHYHVDHVGGFAELAANFPIGEVIDHGPNREPLRAGLNDAQIANAPSTQYALYTGAVANQRRRLMKTDESFVLDGLKVTALVGDRVVTRRKGPPGRDCASATDKEGNGEEENPRALGLLLTWGKARILALTDLTWEMETLLVCPINRIGAVDLMMVDNHGSDLSNPPVLLANVTPRVAVMNNGPTKGGDAAVLQRLAGTTAVLWQLHGALRSPEANTAPERIVNPGRNDHAHLALSVGSDARITVSNPRTGVREVYPPR